MLSSGAVLASCVLRFADKFDDWVFFTVHLSKIVYLKSTSIKLSHKLFIKLVMNKDFK